MSLQAQVVQERAKGSLFSHSAISSHLKLLGYPDKSLNSMLRCGSFTGMKLIKECGCGHKILEMTHHCNLRTCPKCSKIRSFRIFKQFLPIFKKLNIQPHSTESLYFLTISPKNYDSFQEGLNHVKKSFSKFLRNKYIKERIRGGVSVIETKTFNKFEQAKGWHVHLHIIFYGRRLDNRIRGFCPVCKQNLIKFEHLSKKFYCANRKCNNTENLIINQDSKIVQIWKKCSAREVNIRADKIYSTEGALSYVLKYISTGDDSFFKPEEKAVYIFETKKQKLIASFGEKGLFFKAHFEKSPCICHICHQQIKFTFDLEIMEMLQRHLDSIPPPDLSSFENPAAV